MLADRLATRLEDPSASVNAGSDGQIGAASARIAQVQQALDALATDTAAGRRQVLRDDVEAVTLAEDQVAIRLVAHGNGEDGSLPSSIITIPAVRVRRGHDIRLVVAASTPPTPKRDSRLVLLIAEAVTTRVRLETMGTVSIAHAAAWLGCCRSTLTDRIKLSYLAPDIVESILAGRQPRTVTRRRLATVDLPIDWQQQRRMLGFV
jgi:hypothetical protein